MDPLYFLQVLLYTFLANTTVILLKPNCEVSNHEFNQLVLNIKMWLLKY
jgi:hypothetical protein